MNDNTTPVKEIKIPVADPNDPYAIPAAMPSSVDHAVRSFNAGDYPEPSRKQDEWHY
ncbi:MAG: Fe-S cluster assembly protein SufD, partial [Bifidobacterium adolescentis]